MVPVSESHGTAAVATIAIIIVTGETPDKVTVCTRAEHNWAMSVATLLSATDPLTVFLTQAADRGRPALLTPFHNESCERFDKCPFGTEAKIPRSPSKPAASGSKLKEKPP
jgi:hypothetical protein